MHKKSTFTVAMFACIWLLLLSMNARESTGYGAKHVYIRSNGGIEPSDTPISTADNITYALTSDILAWITIERDNIVIDGANHKIVGGGSADEKGINLVGRTNVTVRNMKIETFYDGIYLSGCSHNNITGNSISGNNYDGINIRDFTNYTSIVGNSITSNVWYGIILRQSDHNTIVGNNITANTQIGIYFYISSTDNTVISNIFDKNKEGVNFWESSSNTFYHNNFLNNSWHVFDSSALYPLSQSINSWDNGYPSGGNYWSNYTGIDAKKGPAQDIDGSDGTGDTPQFLYGSNQDNYPLMTAYPIPEFSLGLVVLLFMVATITATVALGKKKTQHS